MSFTVILLYPMINAICVLTAPYEIDEKQNIVNIMNMITDGGESSTAPFIGYDCAAPDSSVTPISLLDVSECNA